VILAGRLSDEAATLLERIGVARDPSLICPQAKLGRLLEARGWPVYAGALEIEDSCSGITIGQKTILGCFAALERRRTAPVARDDELLTYDGARLLPIDGSRMTEFWVDERGVIYEGGFGDVAGDPDGEDWCEPWYESAVTMLERYVLQREPFWPVEPALLTYGQRYAVKLQAAAGASIASAIGAERRAAACDRFATVWQSATALVIERARDGGKYTTTDAWFSTDDELASVRLAVRDHAAGARVQWFGA
jgi:hypothetical protein